MLLVPCVCAMLSSGMAFAQTQGMEANLTGVDPVTNLPTYAVFGLTGVGIGTEAIPSQAQLALIHSDPVGAAEIFVSNSSGGTSASAGIIVQAGSSNNLGTPPFLGATTLSTGFVPPGSAVFLTAGSGTISYASDGITGRNFIIDMTDIAGTITPDLLVTNQSYGQLLAKLAGATGVLSLPVSLGGFGTRCLQVDNAGEVAVSAGACGSGGGTVTSVSGTTGRIIVTPSTPNPVVDLATFGTASTCAWANVVTDAWGRTSCTANTAPQPAGSYITSLNHDVTASGPGAATAEVTGITDSGSTDWQVTGTFANGKALGMVGGGLQAVSFQAPLVACTDYVSLTCVTGATDLGGTNATPTVIGIEDAGEARGYIDWTARSVPANPTGTVTREYNSLFGAGLTTLDSSGNARFMAPNVTCSGANVATSIASGTLACGPASVACGGLPAFTGPSGGSDLSSAGATCVTSVVAIHDATTTQLVLGTIPDSNPQATVLIRGASSTSISGVAASVIADTVTKHDYFINIQSLQPVDTSTRYLATSSSGTVLPGGIIESPNDFIAGHVGYKFYIIDSIGTASSMDCWVTLNGTLITGTDYNFTPGTTSPGVHTQATVATGSASASDTFGMACLYNGNFVTGPFGATIVFTVQLVLTP